MLNQCLFILILFPSLFPAIEIQEMDQRTQSNNLNSQNFAQQSYQKLLAKQAASEDALIELTPDEFQQFMLTKPRLYSLVIFFTADECTPCKIRISQVQNVAELYKTNRKQYASKGDRNQPVRAPVFFVKFKLHKETLDIARLLKISHLPVVYYSKPEELAMRQDYTRTQYGRDHKWKMTRDDPPDSTHKILDWVNKRSGNLDLKFKPRLKTTFLAVGLIISIVSFLLILRLYCSKIVLNRNLWVFIALLIYGFSAGGYMYSRIYGVKFIENDKEGNPVLFMRKTRGQSGIEGILMGSLFILFAWALMMLSHVIVRKSSYFFVKWFLILVCFGMVIYLLNFIEQIFKSKNFYNPTFFPPDYFIKGPLHKDRGIIA